MRGPERHEHPAIANIALVSEHASPIAVLGDSDSGGQNVYISALAHALGRRGMDVIVYTRRDDARIPRRVQLSPRVVLEHLDAGPPIRIARDELLPFMKQFGEQLESAWRRNRPDIVHAHYWMSGVAAVQAASLLHIPIVQTFHALGVTKRRHQRSDDVSQAVRVRAEAAISSAVDAIAATSSEELSELARCGARPRMVDVVPCGVDTTLFQPPSHGSSARRAAPGRLLAVGRLVRRKGVDDIVRSMQFLPDATLVVAGGTGIADDADADRIRRLARSLGVADRVELIGPVGHSSVPELLHSVDVAVCAPWYEPFGMAALEAMACAVPVIATAVGGLRETVVDGHTGIHVEPRDPRGLAAVARRLLDDSALRERLGSGGAERAVSFYTWSRVADSLVRLYERVTRGGSREDGARRSG